MDKIAIVVQQYGLEVNGGAEIHARLLAERLSEKYEVEVLTTTSKDYTSWGEYYKVGDDLINGIKVKRFKTEERLSQQESDFKRYLRRNSRYTNKRYTLSNFIYLYFLKKIYRTKKNHKELFNNWLIAQGPYVPDLIDYVVDNQKEYVAFIFFTYLHFPTYIGVQKVGNKCIFIPTAHDEQTFHFKGMSELFYSPRFIMFNSPKERELVYNTYPLTKEKESDIAGVGFDQPVLANNDLKINCKYILFAGRVNKGKGCQELIDYFIYYKSLYKSDLKLILVGNVFMNVNKYAENKDVIFTGFISEEEKNAYIQNCEALMMPSRLESLSMITLEAMIMGKPTLATEYGQVVKNHIEESETGFLYKGKEEFAFHINKILNLSEKEKDNISKKAVAYVENNYSWSVIIDKFAKAVEYIKSTD